MKRGIIALLLVVAMATPAMAAVGTFDEWVDSGNYGQKLPGMILRGASQVLAVPFDIVLGPYNAYKNDGDPYVLPGLYHGTVDGLSRLVRAAVDIVGAPCPSYTGLEGDYPPCPLTGKTAADA